MRPVQAPPIRRQCMLCEREILEGEEFLIAHGDSFICDDCAAREQDTIDQDTVDQDTIDQDQTGPEERSR
jgi:hypothetical protein